MDLVEQRARRFRSAAEAKINEEKAQKAGALLPKEAAFDSNLSHLVFGYYYT